MKLPPWSICISWTKSLGQDVFCGSEFTPTCSAIQIPEANSKILGGGGGGGVVVGGFDARCSCILWQWQWPSDVMRSFQFAKSTSKAQVQDPRERIYHTQSYRRCLLTSVCLVKEVGKIDSYKHLISSSAWQECASTSKETHSSIRWSLLDISCAYNIKIANICFWFWSWGWLEITNKASLVAA